LYFSVATVYESEDAK